jgi:uncharacterized membrane protein
LKHPLFRTGLVLACIIVVQTVVVSAVDTTLVMPLLQGALTQTFAGREGGIAVFLQGDVPVLLTMQYSVMSDLMTSFLAYPLFVYLLERNRNRRSFIMDRIRSIDRFATKHARKVQRYGPPFLYVFMLVPFMINGPLIGLLLGRLAGLRLGTILVVVVASTITTVIAWTFFYDTLFEWAEQYTPAGPRYIALGVLAFVVVLLSIGFLVERIRSGSRRRQSGPTK